MNRPRVHPFEFSVIQDKTRKLRFSIARDAFASMDLLFLLWEEGYGKGDPFLNAPPEPVPEQPLASYEYTDFDLSPLQPGDLILQTTRFPLHDPVSQLRKQVPQGFTNLEAMLGKFWEQFFGWCCRGSLSLTPDVRRSLLPGCEAYANVELKLNGSADVRHVDDGAGRRGAPPLPGSVAFFLRTNEIWPGGPGLFAAFAMESDATAAWTWLLSERMLDLTRRRGFFMATLEAPPEYESRGWYSGIASEWKAQLVLEHLFHDENA